MFPARYFPRRYFAPRYWAKVGQSSVISDLALCGEVHVTHYIKGTTEAATAYKASPTIDCPAN